MVSMRGLCGVLGGLVVGCGPGGGKRPCAADHEAEILVMGDSILAYHADDCASIADVASEALDRPVANAARSGARIAPGGLYAFGDIRNQYEDGDWDWVVLEGGVNDLRGRCGREERVAEVIDELVSEDGAQGEVPDLVDQALTDGAQVALLTLYELPESASFGFGKCGDALDELHARYARVADTRDDVVLVEMGAVMHPETTPEAYRGDGVHPTELGSALVGEWLAEALVGFEEARTGP